MRSVVLAMLAVFSLVLSPGAKATGCGLSSPAVSYSSPIDFDYRVWGSENSPNGTIILIPGLGSTWQTFERLAPLLAEQYQVVAYSQAGHGKTTVTSSRTDFSNRAMAWDLTHLMDILGLESAHILGHSLGTRTALKFAELFPNKIQSMILEDHEFRQRQSSMPDYALDLATLKNFSTEFDSRSDALRALTDLSGSAESAQYLLMWKTYEFNGKIHLGFKPYAIQLYKQQSNSEDLGPALNKSPAHSLLVLSAPEKSDMTAAGLEHLRRFRPEMPVIHVRNAEHSIHNSNADEFLAIVQKFIFQQ